MELPESDRDDKSSSSVVHNYDDALRLAGDFGRWQAKAILFCSLVWGAAGCAVVTWSFTAYPMGHRCAAGRICEPDAEKADFDGR